MKTLTPIAALALCLSLGCATLPPGTLMHAPANPQLASGGPWTIAVAPPRDARPAIEREGDSPHTRFFFTLIFFWWIEKRGSWVTSDYSASPNAMPELAQLAATYLQRTGAFRGVVAGGPADFVLEADVLHLYATYYEARRTIVIINPGDKSSGPDYHQSTAQVAFAPYGNAVIRYRLYDTRNGQRRLVWQRTVTGSAQLPPANDATRLMPVVVRDAAVQALTAMALHVTRAVEEYAPPPFDPAAWTAAAEGQIRAGQLQFVVERHAVRRTASELLVIDAASGRVAGHRLATNAATPIGRPGDWMLSRERPDGTLMPYVEYAALANFLARHYDLRRVDEMYHYHFFGQVGHAAVERRVAPVAAR
jgi:hypothetical protein